MLSCKQCKMLDECGGYEEAMACDEFDRKSEDDIVVLPVNPVEQLRVQNQHILVRLNDLERAFNTFMTDIRNATMGEQ